MLKTRGYRGSIEFRRRQLLVEARCLVVFVTSGIEGWSLTEYGYGACDSDFVACKMDAEEQITRLLNREAQIELILMKSLFMFCK